MGSIPARDSMYLESESGRKEGGQWAQLTKKLMSRSSGLVDFDVRLVDFVLHLPSRQVKVLGDFFLRKLILFIVLARIVLGQ